MNFRLLSKYLGVVALLIGGMMLLSLPWAWPPLGHRNLENPAPERPFEYAGFRALLVSVVVCGLVGGALLYLGRKSRGRLFRREAMAAVGLSWILATVLGALPYYFSGTYRSAAVRLVGDDARQPIVYNFDRFGWSQWIEKGTLPTDRLDVLRTLLAFGARGLDAAQLQEIFPTLDAPGILHQLDQQDEDWGRAIILPGEEPDAPLRRRDHFRIRWVRMSLIDALFESQSGFSTTGATVIADVEDPALVPHCILFWRSSTHFLGGLGIIVLFVVILGQGSAGKALMRTEMPGPTKEGMTPRMQVTAWWFAGIYCALNLVLIIVLMLFGLTLFDATCHAFGTMATGGFSTYNTSIGHFESPAIDYVITLFMILAGTNFTLLYFALVRWQFRKLTSDIEWRTYVSVIAGVTLLVVLFGYYYGDFAPPEEPWYGQLQEGLRYSLFQVTSIMTTTGYMTHDFDQWNSFGRGVLFLLMFVGGCAGSTGGGLKVIRHILFLKILWLEIEQAYHPSVVRPVRLGGVPWEAPDLRKNILAYFGLILAIFVFSWILVVMVEPRATWGSNIEHKLIDSASGIAATLNNIGPGLGTVGATQNYGHFSAWTKLLFIWLMMIGRLEIFSILVLFVPSFWRSR